MRQINSNGVAALERDVAFLVDFVAGLHNPVLLQQLDELRQTVALLQTEAPEEFFDIAISNRKYGRVDRLNGPLLLEK